MRRIVVRRRRRVRSRRARLRLVRRRWRRVRLMVMPGRCGQRMGRAAPTGLETGGVVVDGVAHGLCPGFPNPGEMELLEPSGGGDGIAYGVVGYPGTAKVAIYSDTFGNFAATKLVGSTTAQKVNGVGFFITSLSESACDVSGVEMNTASSSYATEHNLGFATSDCKNGQLVPISDSQGIWQLPTSGFPNKFQSAGGVGGGAPSAPTPSKGGWLPASDISGGHRSPGASDCAPQTTSGSGSASTLEAVATKVARVRLTAMLGLCGLRMGRAAPRAGDWWRRG